MRVVRIKHKTGIAVVVILCIAGLLWLISKKSNSEEYFETGNFPTRSVDFISIAKQIKKDYQEKIWTRTTAYKRVDTRGKSRIRGRKGPRPPKKIISNQIVEKKVVKDIVHGDDQNGGLGRHNIHKQRPKPKTINKSKVKKVHHMTPHSKPKTTYTIAVLVIACNRPDAIKKCLDTLLKYRPSSEQFPVIVSQDCGDDATARAIGKYGNQVKHIKQPDLSEINVDGNMRRFRGYYKISRHYKWALGQIFDHMSYDTVLIVEDDLEIAPDFYNYFLATRALLDTDPSIWCVSAWNDNGKQGMVDGNGLLYRSDFFPGLGWMMTKSLWNELRPKWPLGFWDDWMREAKQRKGRACIRPEISRTKTFGRVGVSQGQFFDQHLKYIILNDKKFDFLHEDLSYLVKKRYDKAFLGKVAALPVFSIQDIMHLNIQGNKIVRVKYSSEYDFKLIASKLGVMEDFKAGVPRTGYHGIVTVIFKGVRVYITPTNIEK